MLFDRFLAWFCACIRPKESLARCLCRIVLGYVEDIDAVWSWKLERIRIRRVHQPPISTSTNTIGCPRESKFQISHMLLPSPSCALILIIWTANAVASSGDRSHSFESCVLRCWTTQCHPMPKTLALPLRLTRWTCTDDCKYTCMHQITDRDVQKGGRVHQYYGKWPFWRFAGMQEPASVAFSVLNLWAQVQGNSRIRTQIPAGHPMKPYYIVWSLVSMNTWLWSSVFHTRGE